MTVPLDEVDIQLLTALQEDADRTNVELARMAGLSPAATLHRVRRLKESGVIRVIRAEVDPVAAGFPLQMYVTATLARHDPRSSRVFDDLIRSLPQIVAPPQRPPQRQSERPPEPGPGPRPGPGMRRRRRIAVGGPPGTAPDPGSRCSPPLRCQRERRRDRRPGSGRFGLAA